MPFERRDGKPPTHPIPDWPQRTRDIKMVWDLRDELFTFKEIAEMMGIGESTVRKYFNEGLRATMITVSPESERQLMVNQIDEAMKRIRVLIGRTNDITELMKLEGSLERYMRRKATLLGLDAAQKFDIRSTKRSQLDEAIEGLAEEMNQAERDRERLNKLEDRRKGFRAP